MQLERASTFEQRRADIRFIIQDALGRPERPPWHEVRHLVEEGRRGVLEPWIQACADWDRANGQRVEQELDFITEAAQRMLREGFDVPTMRGWVLERARSVRP